YPGGEPGHVQTTVTVVNQQLEIDYRDTGIGIPPSRRQLVFEPFQTTKREEGRIGIGLYTLSLLVDRFDGSASIAPMDGPGTRFLITLKLDDAEASPQRQPEQSDSN
ncbi:MAG: ATP-binding protein, partial [Spirochaetales bacterium]